MIYIAVCSSGCYNGGFCSAPNTCSCTTGWAGPTCTTGILSIKVILILLDHYLIVSHIATVTQILQSFGHS